MDIPFLLAAEAGATQNLSIFDPVSPPAVSIRHLAIFVLAVCAAIFFIVEAILVYSIWKFRGRNPSEGEPPQVYGSKPIEIAWTAAPTLIVFLLVLVIIRTEWEVRADPAKPPKNSEPLYVTVIGRQWWWEFRYDKIATVDSNGQIVSERKLDFLTANELHVPASETGKPRPVYLTLQSADVVHSFWVPRLAGKTDLIPGRTNHMWFQTDQPGLYLGQCAEYCGTQHANMLLRVYVDSPDVFERWVANEMKPAVEPTSPEIEKGRKAFLAQSCVNCHAVRGTSAKGTYAPDLTHLMSRETLASGIIRNNPTDLRRWIDDPQKIKPGCLMPQFPLGDLEAVAAYLTTLK